MQNQLIYRDVITKKLKRIFEPTIEHSSYHTIIRNYGTGKTTVIRQCAKNIGKEVIYVDVPPVLDNFINNFAKAIGFKEYMSITKSLKQKILGNGKFGKVIVKKKYWYLLCIHFFIL
jgi:AAA+ ATPase superfamily predicted ATPase